MITKYQTKLELLINKNGYKHQSMIAMEECSELSQAISKCVRYPTRISRLRLIEEIADVAIVIEQLKLMYEITDGEISTCINEKLERTLNNEHI